MSPRRIVLILCAVAAFALPGCAVFKTTPTAIQLDQIGHATIILDVCASQAGGQPPCDRSGYSTIWATDDTNGDGQVDHYQYQVLLGFRIPTAATPPAGFGTASGAPLVFTQNDSATAAYQKLKPAPAGQKWVGYLSDAEEYKDSGPQGFSVQPEFALGQGPGGEPFDGPFQYRPVVGVRGVVPAYNDLATRPVDCGTTGISQAGATVCIDDPAPADVDTDLTLVTRDLGVVPAAGVASTTPGGLVNVPFVLPFDGPNNAPALEFALSTSTGVPGGSADVTPGSVVPVGDSSTPVNVAVGVPAGTPPGDYPVTLTAKLPNGQTRTGTGTVHVVAAPAVSVKPPPVGTPPPPPTTKLNLVLPKKAVLKTVKKHGVKLLVGSTAATSAKVTAYESRKTLLTRTVKLKSPGPLSITLKSRKFKKGTVTVTVAGTGFTQTVKLKLK